MQWARGLLQSMQALSCLSETTFTGTASKTHLIRSLTSRGVSCMLRPASGAHGSPFLVSGVSGGAVQRRCALSLSLYLTFHT